MTAELLKLYPPPSSAVPLEGCYLNTELAPKGFDGLFLYTNFVASIDGRISVVRPRDSKEVVPKAIANRHDWRLFQELAGHADVLITSGRYLRDLAVGTAQDVLPLSSAGAFADIRRWRQHQDYAAQPDVAVMSASLDFRIPRSLLDQGRRVFVLTAEQADAERAAERRAEGGEVAAFGGGERVNGRAAAAFLAARGYTRAYCVTGPHVLRTFVAAGLLDSLFVTTVHRLLGGKRFATLLEGDRLDPPTDFRLVSLYQDATEPQGVGQTFARYDRCKE